MRQRRWDEGIPIRRFGRWATMAVALSCGVVTAQVTNPVAVAPAGSPNQATTPEPPRGVELDRVIAVVNEDVILESDVDQETRLMAFQPFRDASRRFGRTQIIERLINRALILRQSQLQPEGEVTDKQVAEQLTALRKAIPACKEYHCETDEGWNRFVKDQGFSMEELTKLWRERMEVLRFIELRFRSGTEISKEEIRDYYEKTLLPQYAKQGAVAPKLEVISDRIQEVLLQQQVSNLLGDWLKSLRAQGTVRTIQQGEAAE